MGLNCFRTCRLNFYDSIMSTYTFCRVVVRPLKELDFLRLLLTMILNPFTAKPAAMGKLFFNLFVFCCLISLSICSLVDTEEKWNKILARIKWASRFLQPKVHKYFIYWDLNFIYISRPYFINRDFVSYFICDF